MVGAPAAQPAQSAAWSRVDLHLHTTASDGSLAPADLVALALKRGLRAIAITDHDSTGGVDAALAAAQGTVLEVIPGVEINTDLAVGEAHILGYYLDHHDPDLQETLSRQRAGRFGRGGGMVQRLRDLGLDVSWERVQEIAGAASGGAVGRPHVALALLEKGYVASVAEAFEKYIGNGGPAYVPREKLAPQEAVRIVRRAGGLPALAHPADLPDLGTFVAPLLEAGLAGLECYYGDYPEDVVQRLLGLARDLDLVPTGGSDFHGPDVVATAVLGGTPVPATVVDELKARHAALRSS